MDCKFLTWIFGGARGADKSAVATINRALRVSGLFCQSALFSPLLYIRHYRLHAIGCCTSAARSGILPCSEPLQSGGSGDS